MHAVLNRIRSRKSLTALALIVATGFTGIPFSAEAVACTASNIRWAGSSNTVYISGGAVCTLTDIDTLGHAAIPLTLVDAPGKVWFLGANIFLQQGAELSLRGDAVGGDANELRLKSNNVSNGFVWIRAEWGTVRMDHTKVTSWNESAAGPDTEYQSYGRAHIRVRSWLDGATPRESRMDILSSEVGHLGYNTAEGYGLTWKVISPQFDLVGVFGDVVDSTIHHNYFGIYTYGGEGMTFRDNEIFENVKYGLDPHDDSDNLLIEGNFVHHNGNHGIICSQRCNNLHIIGNTSSHNTGNGIMLHRNTNDSLVEDNTTNDNTDSGIAIFDSHRNTVRNNEALRNLKSGIRLSVGSSENVIEDNIFSDGVRYGMYFYKGSDAPTSGDGRPKLNTLRRNTVSGNSSVAAKVGESDTNLFEENTFSGNSGSAIELSSANGNTFEGNTLTGNSLNYYYAKSKSVNVVRNSDVFSVKIGDASSTMTMIDASRAVLKNTKNVPSVVSPINTTLLLTRALSGSSIVGFTTLPFTVTPSTGSVSVSVLTWNTSGDYLKRWSAIGTTSSSITVDHAVGNLLPGGTYRVFAGASLLGSFIADGTGTIVFTYSGSLGTATVFEVRI